MKTIRIAFYGQIKRIEPERIANKILRFEENRETQVSWVKKVCKYLEKTGIRGEDITNRNVFRLKTAKVKDGVLDKEKRTKKVKEIVL